MYVETGRYLRQMMRDIEGAGGRIAVRGFASPAEIASLPETLVFNCTGLGTRELFGDSDLIPIRGQLTILMSQTEVHDAFTLEAGYMFLRPDGIVIGGRDRQSRSVNFSHQLAICRQTMIGHKDAMTSSEVQKY